MHTHLTTAFAIALLALPLTATAQEDATPPPTPDPAHGSAEPASPAEEASPVARATFTTRVVDNEPVDELDQITGDLEEVYFFTEITGLSGALITHRWMHDGEIMAEIPIEIGGPRWRVHSIKTMPGDITGTWSVEVVDASGVVIHTSELGGDDGDVQVSDLSPQQ